MTTAEMSIKDITDDVACLEKITNFQKVWEGLEATAGRGIHIYDDKSGEMIYTSYRDMVTIAGKLAGRLKRCGIDRGDQVMLSAKTIPEFPVIWLALIWVGATPVPMVPRETLLGQKSYEHRLSMILPYFNCFLCFPDEIQEIRSCAAGGERLRILNIPELLLNLDDDEDIPERCNPGLDDTAFVQFTSGSTNNPKGIIITYQNLYANIDSIMTLISNDRASARVISWLPLYHDMGLVGKFITSLFNQLDLVLTSPQYFAKRPLNFLKLIDAYQARFCGMPNFALEWIIKRLKKSKQADFDLSSLKWLCVGAEPISLKTLETFLQALRPFGLNKSTISPCYGLAEATLIVSGCSPNQDYKICKYNDKPIPGVGQTLKGLNVMIELENPTDSIGIVKIKSESVAEYALVEGERISLLDERGYYNTGDMGYFDGDELVIVGRIDEMFIINGENRFPYDIESVIRNMDGILRNRVACFGVPGANNGASSPEIIVLCETRNMRETERLKLTSDVKERIVTKLGLKVSRVLRVPPKSIPVTPSGKIQRKQAAVRYREGYYNGGKAGLAPPQIRINGLNNFKTVSSRREKWAMK